MFAWTGVMLEVSLAGGRDMNHWLMCKLCGSEVKLSGWYKNDYWLMSL